MIGRQEIERRWNQYWKRLEADYGPDELEEMEKAGRLDPRTVDEVMQDLGDQEFHRQRDEGRDA